MMPNYRFTRNIPTKLIKVINDRQKVVKIGRLQYHKGMID